MKTDLSSLDFIVFREVVTQLERSERKEATITVDFPAIASGPPSAQESIDLYDILRSSINAVAKASSRLAAGGMSMGKAPIRLKFSGQVTGVADNGSPIFLKITPEKKKKNA